MLLSETELRAALEPLLDRLLVERLRLFQLQLEPRLQALIAAALDPQGSAELQACLRRLETGRTPGDCFATLFELSASLLGPRRALLVVRKAEAAVWRQQGLNLPARFPLARRDEMVGQWAAIRVREQVVGELHWPGAALPAAVALRLDLMLRWAGRVLLEQALPAKPSAPAMAPAANQPARVDRPALPGSGAQRFAALLVEDLRLYLERERPGELALALRGRDWQERFAPELLRCQQAFAGRYPEESLRIFEGEVPRLA